MAVLAALALFALQIYPGFPEATRPEGTRYVCHSPAFYFLNHGLILNHRLAKTDWGTLPHRTSNLRPGRSPKHLLKPIGQVTCGGSTLAVCQSDCPDILFVVLSTKVRPSWRRQYGPCSRFAALFHIWPFFHRAVPKGSSLLEDRLRVLAGAAEDE